MNLSSGFITRPIATALLMVAVVVLGIVSYRLLPVAALPNIDTPTIQVTAQLPGADPQTVASSVTTQLERQFGQIPGLNQMSSSSGTGFTSITLQFDRSRTVDSAAQDVQATINATQAQLPISLLTSPIYRKTNPADTPILLVSMTSDVLPIMTVSDYAYSILAQKVSQVPGVGLVTVGGNLTPSIRIQLNPAQLANMNLDFETVRLALANLTVVQPTGLLYGSQQAAALQTNDQLMTAQGFDDAIVAYRNGAPIRIRDIGRAIRRPWTRRSEVGSTASRPSCCPFFGNPAPMSCRPSRQSRKPCRNSGPRCRRALTSKSYPTEPKRSQPALPMCASRCS